MSRLSILVGLALLVSVGGCRSATQENLRDATYAPDFRYYEKKDVKDHMHVVAKDVRALQSVLRDRSLDPVQEQMEVVRLLDDISAELKELDGNAAASNHKKLETHLGQFQRDVEEARAAAAGDPPNYFLAGTVAGSCIYCHRSD